MKNEEWRMKNGWRRWDLFFSEEWKVKSEKWRVKSEEWKIALTQLGVLAINKTTKRQNNQTTSFLVKKSRWRSKAECERKNGTE